MYLQRKVHKDRVNFTGLQLFSKRDSLPRVSLNIKTFFLTESEIHNLNIWSWYFYFEFWEYVLLFQDTILSQINI